MRSRRVASQDQTFHFQTARNQSMMYLTIVQIRKYLGRPAYVILKVSIWFMVASLKFLIFEARVKFTMKEACSIRG